MVKVRQIFLEINKQPVVHFYKFLVHILLFFFNNNGGMHKVFGGRVLHVAGFVLPVGTLWTHRVATVLRGGTTAIPVVGGS